MSDSDYSTSINLQGQNGPLDLAKAQSKLLELVISLQRCDQHLFQLSRMLPIPVDSQQMGEDQLPHDLGMHLYAIIGGVRQESLNEAIQTLYSATQADDQALRRDFRLRQKLEGAN